jgi:hypothetical protein
MNNMSVGGQSSEYSLTRQYEEKEEQQVRGFISDAALGWSLDHRYFLMSVVC